jgi:DNA-binding MarR family transcriptional regulator
MSESTDTRQAAVKAAASGVQGLLRTVRKAKARLLETRGSVETATQAVLQIVAAEGPMRTSALAASAQSDLSTISRQVAGLVAAGLLERRADPMDGRASLLAVTTDGAAVVAQHEEARAAFFADVLDGWSADELQQFASLLGKFTVAYDQVHAARLAERRPRPVRPVRPAQAERSAHALDMPLASAKGSLS